MASSLDQWRGDAVGTMQAIGTHGESVACRLRKFTSRTCRRALPRASTTPLTWTFRGYNVRSYEWGFVMIASFTAALARVQNDFDFYVGCQTDPDATLAEYDLSAAERAALTDPDVLADVLKKGLMPRNRPSITVKISGTHDWVNRTKKPQRKVDEARIQREVQTIRDSVTDEDRTQAAVRLMELIG
jgi:hypothetical protein